MNRMLRFGTIALLSLVFFTSSTALKAQSIPTPASQLGFEPGDDRKLADWEQITKYFTALDKASDRVMLREVGKSTQGRPFLMATISSSKNLKNLKKYQEIQAKLADPRKIKSSSELEELIKKGKNVVAISCSIHSNEVVAAQMSMQLAYTLASEKSDEMKEILDNTIILLFPSTNPDGVDIVNHWYWKTLDTKSEGTIPPELYHPYAGHDNNRDWFMLNLVETRNVTDVFYKEWFPQIVYDVHQQGQYSSRMFVPPFLDPPNPNIDPTLLRQVALIGTKMAMDLQAAGFKGVATNMLYDTWWHGGMRTAPYYHNAVGILTEAASVDLATPLKITNEEMKAGKKLRANVEEEEGGRRFTIRGLPNALERATHFPDPWQEGEWRPKDILKMEMMTSRSLLKMVTLYRETFLRNFYEAGKRAVEASENDKEQPIAFVIPKAQRNEFAALRMVSILAAQGIEIHEATKNFTIDGTDYEAGSRVVKLNQPYRAGAKALLEVQQYPERRLYPNGPAEPPYDVAGWTLPMQMGVDCFAVKQKFEAELKLLSDAELREAVKKNHPHFETKARVGLYKSFAASMDEGWTRLVFDQYQLKYSSLLDTEIRSGNLREKYDVIVLPDQGARAITNGQNSKMYPEEFSGGIGKDGVKNLQSFVEAGGTLICFDGSARFAIQEFKLPVKNVLTGIKSSDFYCPGSILKVELDQNHPITKGYGATVDAYFSSSSAFEIMDPQQILTVGKYAETNVLRSGWLLGEKYLAGKSSIVDAKLGSGHVVLFGFRPQHRAQTVGTYGLVFNAINFN
jgi:Zinc carboxypeptidase